MASQRVLRTSRAYVRALTLVLAGVGLVAEARAQPAGPVAAPTPAPAEADLPTYLKDRGTGIPTSMFGTYIRRGELIIYPFFEYYYGNSFEYKPSELGVVGEEDFLGRYRASEGLFFVSYGITDGFAIEMEAAVIRASLEKSPTDPSALPPKLKESGLGDVEGQFRWRWRKETEGGPEVFSYFEFVFPHHKDKVLIGTPGWELKLGGGLVRGFRWGTLTARLAVDYEEASTSHFDLGEYAVEYLKRVNRHLRLYVGLEGSQDELSLITEAQWHLNRHVFIRFNNGLGLTAKALDWTPEVGILLTLPTR